MEKELEEKRIEEERREYEKQREFVMLLKRAGIVYMGVCQCCSKLYTKTFLGLRKAPEA